MTRTERRALNFYVKYRHANPTWGGVIGFNYHLVLYWLALIAVGIALVVTVPKWWAHMFLGAMFGAMLRDLRRMRSIAKQWPMQREMLDWNEIERRLAGAGTSPPVAAA